MAREAAKAARDAEIARLASQGRTTREIARATGVSLGTAHHITSVQKRNSSTSERAAFEPTTIYAAPGAGKSSGASLFTEDEPDEDEAPASPFADLANPASARWSDLLNRLRVLNAQTDPDLLLAERRPKMEPRLVPAPGGENAPRCEGTQACKPRASPPRKRKSSYGK